jgi:hypothetical protein
MGYDAIALDPHTTREAAGPDLPWLAPNAARTLSRGGLRIAIVAVDERIDATPAGRAVAAEGPVDLVVLLCNGDLHFATGIARSLRAGVCVVARGATLREPYTREGTLFLGPGRDGKYIGLAEVEIPAPRQTRAVTVTLRPMDGRVPTPTTWRERVEEVVLSIEKAIPGAFSTGE